LELREIFFILAAFILKKLCVKNWENIEDYIDYAQIVHDNIIGDEKNEKQRRPLTNSDIARIRSMCACVLLWITKRHSDINRKTK